MTDLTAGKETEGDAAIGNKRFDATERTSRILSTFHFFLYCEEVEYNTLMKAFSVSKKTARRDICLLERAGVLKARFDQKKGAFVPDCLDLRPMEPVENETQQKYLGKIRRICILMAELDGLEENDNPIALYRHLFPSERARTRQRDFAELRKLGYVLAYSGAELGEPGGWSVQIPPAFGLDTIPEDVNWWE